MNGDEATTQFGTGCTRWLHFVVSGHGELGRTPAFSELTTQTAQKRRKHLRYEPHELDELAHLTGITHAVTSQLSGAGDQLSLVMRLWAISRTSPAAPVGTQLMDTQTLSGSRGDIITALPGAARQMALQLGIKTPQVPERIDLSPEEVVVLGSVPLNAKQSYSPAIQARLVKMAEREPLAGILAARETKTRSQMVRLVLQSAPTNLTALAALSITSANLLSPYEDQWEPALKRFPHNYQAAFTQGAVAQANRDLAAFRSLSELGVRCAPENPAAWVRLGSAISDQADSVRNGAFISRMTELQLRTVTQAYPLWQAALQRAARLDPQNGDAWYYLATAATFNGDSAVADQAFGKAQQLWPDDPAIYSWGLEMYHPKWGGDPQKLLKVAELIAANDALFPTLGGGVTGVLMLSNLKNERERKLLFSSLERLINDAKGPVQTNRQLRRILPPLWKAVQEKPAEVQRWMAFGSAASQLAEQWHMGRAPGEMASKEIEVSNLLFGFKGLSARYVLVLKPTTHLAVLEYAVTGIRLGTLVPMEGVILIERVIEREPANPAPYRAALNFLQPNWGGDPDMLWDVAQRASASPTLFESLAPNLAGALQTLATPNDAQAALLRRAQSKLPELTTRDDAAIQSALGFYYWRTGQSSNAATAFENWARLEPDNPESHYYYAILLGKLGQSDAALQEYRAALRVNPDYGPALVYGGQIALIRDKAEEAETMLRHAVEVMPFWPEAHSLLGSTLNKLQRRNEARAAWQTAVDLAGSKASSIQAALLAQRELERNPAQ